MTTSYQLSADRIRRPWKGTIDEGQPELLAVLDELAESDAPRRASAVLTLEPTASGAVLSGTLAARMSLRCSICDEPVEWSTDSSFRCELVVGTPPESGEDAEYELSTAELDQVFIADQVDVIELIREQLLLELPYNPRCEDERVCGQRLSAVLPDGSAEAPSAKRNPFAALKGLKLNA